MPPYHTEQLRKLFIGGLSLETTEDGLREYFSRWGNIVDVVVMRFPDTRRSRGFGFVTYESVESVDAVLEAKPHVLEGKEIEPKRAVAKDESGNATEGGPQEKVNKVFVGGLASATTEEDIRDCFETFCNEAGHGKIEEVLIMKDADTGRLRGFCFVTFDSSEIVDKICSVKYFEIRTKTVEVRRAESRVSMMKKQQRDNSYTKRSMDHRRRDNRYEESGRGGFGLNQMALLAQAQAQGGRLPFSGGGNANVGAGVNPMALAGMMSMFFSQMANMGGMAGNLPGNLAGNMAGNMAGNLAGNMAANLGMNQRGLNTDVLAGRDNMDAYRASTAVTNTAYKPELSVYGDQTSGNLGDISGYTNAMNAMLGAAGMNPANLQAALYNAYATGGTGTGSGQLGSYDQSSSTYGPSRGSSTTNRGYKPY